MIIQEEIKEVTELFSRKENLKRRLEDLYPDKIIDSLYEKDNQLYSTTLNLTKELNITSEELFSELGFINEKKISSDTEEEIVELLLELFPDGFVKNLSTKSAQMYYRVKNIADEKSLSVNDFLDSLGFTTKKKYHSEESIFEQLLDYYPDGEVIGLSVKDNHLYARINYLAKEKGVDLKTYLEELGFELSKKRRKTLEISGITEEDIRSNAQKYGKIKKYDELLIKELTREYGLFESDFADMFCVTRQALNAKLSRAKKSTVSWLVKEFDEETLAIFNRMISEEIMVEESDTHHYYIGANSTTNKFVLLVFPKNLTEMPSCLKDEDIPENIVKQLIERDYLIFSPKNFRTLQELRNATPEQNGPHGYLSNILKNLANKHHDYCVETGNLERYEGCESIYIQFAAMKGIPYPKPTDGRQVSDEEIVKILKRFYIKEFDLVKIPSADPEYHRIVNLAQNRGYSLKEFIELHGFKYRRVPVPSLKRKQRTLEKLKKYIVYENYIYISSYEKLYMSLTNIARNQGLTLSELLLKEYKLQRIEHPRDLPKFYKPFIQGDELEDLTKEEDFVKYIEENLLLDPDDDYIYLDGCSSFCITLTRYCYQTGTSLEIFLEKHRFTRMNLHESLQYLTDLGFSEIDARIYLNALPSNAELPKLDEPAENLIEDDGIAKENFEEFEAELLGFLLTLLEEIAREEEMRKKDDGIAKENFEEFEAEFLEFLSTLSEELKSVEDKRKKALEESESASANADTSAIDENEDESIDETSPLTSDSEGDDEVVSTEVFVGTNNEEDNPDIVGEVLEEDLTEQEDEPGISDDTEEESGGSEGRARNTDDLLQRLKNLSNEITSSVVEFEKRSRSQKLVRLMKEMYDYKCQLCEPDNPIPAIEMISGKDYVEMHHIIHLSNASAEDESDLILDSYKNAIVVCPHHHKVLHYHNGGYTELDEMIDGLYFVNDSSEIKIYTNKHLSIDDF